MVKTTTIYTQDGVGHSREYYVRQIIHDAVNSILQQYCEARSGMTALDVGCGEQPYRALIQQAGFEYQALDIASREGASLDYTGSLEDTELINIVDGRLFDLVICTEVVEHLLDHTTVFNNLVNMTKSGGMVLITTPFIYPLHESPYDFWRPTCFALEKLAQNAGFEVVEQHRKGSYSQLISTLMFDAYSIAAVNTIRERLRNRLMNIALSFVNKQLASGASIYSQAELYLTNVFILRKN